MFMSRVAGLASVLVGLVAAQTTTLQAESATLSGVTIATSVAGYTGLQLVLVILPSLT